ncbi:FmdB family zinc ribbon protein [Rivibacter subsaxonicus]|uniref:Putative FmdB family regulatory protein n=1 Tax=Rivibacter subsaxonicus TaxID=457575 RepID=A0A4Q7VZQ9_9BURK|nr:FmdB family zinc ribbon protein [Rivibacter subsaxonicus]RZU02280.1 putative FmdB family regulatory protein [Rivibacter subsaxonicus]
MPIYAYRCDSCGHARDVLQRLSDPVLSDCPACGAATFRKQVTAAGFQLKGSGWYVTDFRNGNGSSTPAKPAAEGAGTDAAPAAAPAKAEPTPAATASGSTGTDSA